MKLERKVDDNLIYIEGTDRVTSKLSFRTDQRTSTNLIIIASRAVIRPAGHLIYLVRIQSFSASRAR